MTRNRIGAALVLAMFIVVLLILAGTGLMYMSYQSRLMAIRVSQDMASRICADAGLQRAIQALNMQLASGPISDANLPVSIGETLPASEGAFSYKIIKNDDGKYVAVSVGARGDFRRIIMAVLDRKTKSCFDYGILTKDGFTVASGITMSAYDSQNPSASDLHLEMGALSTGPSSVVIKPGAVVNGDLFCGVGGNPSSAIINDGTVNGKIYALTNEPEVVQPEMPASLPVTGKNITVKGATITVTPADSGVYDVININSTGTPGRLIIDGGTVSLGVTSLLALGNQAEIVVREGSTLIMYVSCNISSANGASVSYAGAAKDPSHIQIYGTSKIPQIWALKAKDDWTGVVYAPNAYVAMAAGGNVYGALMVDSVDFKSSSNYYYDVNLQRAGNIALSGPAGFGIKRWSESSIGDVPDWAY